MYKFLSRTILIFLSVFVAVYSCGCESNLDLGSSEDTAKVTMESSQAVLSGLQSSSSEIISSNIVQEESGGITSLTQSDSAMPSAESVAQVHNTFVSGKVRDFIDWAQNNEDKTKENQAFLSAVKDKKKLLLPVPKNTDLREYSVDVAENSARYMLYWIIGEDIDASTSKLFGNTITFIDEADKKADLKELYLKYVSKYTDSEQIKTSQYKDINYAYTDYAEDDKGNRILFSKACFVVDDFVVCLFLGHSIGEKPFDPEYLSYFEYEITELNIKS